MKTLKANIRPVDVSSIEVLNAKHSKRAHNRQRNFTNITMLVKMANYNAKVELLKKKKAIGVLFDQQRTDHSGPKREIYFRDHLTTYSNSLFGKARALKTTSGVF